MNATQLQEVIDLDIKQLYKNLKELVNSRILQLEVDIRNSSSYVTISQQLQILNEMSRFLQSHLTEDNKTKFSSLSNFVQQQVEEKKNAIVRQIYELRQSGASVIDTLASDLDQFSKVGHLYENTPLYTDVVATLEEVVISLASSIKDLIEESPQSSLPEMQHQTKVLKEITNSSALTRHVSPQTKNKFAEVISLLANK